MMKTTGTDEWNFEWSNSISYLFAARKKGRLLTPGQHHKLEHNGNKN